MRSVERATAPTRIRRTGRLSELRAILSCVSHSWGRPAREPGDGWAVIDVETSGFRPGQARVISLAALGARRRRARRAFGGQPAQSRRRPRTHPRARPDRRDAGRSAAPSPRSPPTSSSCCTAARWSPTTSAFDYAFLAAEAELAGAELPDRHRDVHRRTGPPAGPRPGQSAAGDPGPALGRASRSAPTTRSTTRWCCPGCWRRRCERAARPRRLAAGASGDPPPLAQRPGHPRRTAAAEGAGLPDAVPVPEPRAVCPRPAAGPGHAGRVVRRGATAPTRNSSSGSCTPGWPTPTPSTRETSLVICNEPTPEQGKGYLARELGVPVVSDAQFMDTVDGRRRRHRDRRVRPVASTRASSSRCSDGWLR